MRAALHHKIHVYSYSLEVAISEYMVQMSKYDFGERILAEEARIDSRPRLDASLACLHKFGSMDRATLTQHQIAAVHAAVTHHYRGNLTYRALCDSHGVTPDDLRSLDDLRRFPIIERDFLAEHPMRHGPGGALSVPMGELASFLNSSGSTGRSKRIPIAAVELDSIAETCAIALWIGGLRGHRDDGGTLLPIFPHGPWPGALFVQSGCEIIGFAPKADMGLPFEWQRRCLEELDVRHLVTTPSYITALERDLSSHGDPAGHGLERILLGGEYFSEGFRAEVERRFGCRVLDVYGCGETQIVSVESDDLYEHRRGFMYHLAHMSYIEVVRPGTNEPVPAGTPGEMVITVFNRRAWPVVRYRVGDMITLPPMDTLDERLRYRFPLMSRIQGRADDMLKYGNVMLFPETFFQALARHAQSSPRVPLSLDKFRFELDDNPEEGLRCRARLRIELAAGRVAEVGPSALDEIRGQVLDALTAQSDELRHAIYVGRQVPAPEIDILDAGTLYTQEQKLRRIVDRRQAAR